MDLEEATLPPPLDWFEEPIVSLIGDNCELVILLYCIHSNPCTFSSIPDDLDFSILYDSFLWLLIFSNVHILDQYSFLALKVLKISVCFINQSPLLTYSTWGLLSPKGNTLPYIVSVCFNACAQRCNPGGMMNWWMLSQFTEWYIKRYYVYSLLWYLCPWDNDWIPLHVYPLITKV